MTEAQKQALTAGRERAQAARTSQAVLEVAEFRAWLREDAYAFHAIDLAIMQHGHGSQQHRAANAHWREVAERMPPPPPDSKWQAAA